MGGSLVILIAASRMLWGMICPSGVGAGSALKNNLEKIQFVINVRGAQEGSGVPKRCQGCPRGVWAT